MSKSKQIEKLAKKICKTSSSGCNYPTCSKCAISNTCKAHIYATRVVDADYIDGPGFINWLKSSHYVKPYMDDVDYCEGIDIKVLDEALHEYFIGGESHE